MSRSLLRGIHFCCGAPRPSANALCSGRNCSTSSRLLGGGKLCRSGSTSATRFLKRECIRLVVGCRVRDTRRVSCISELWTCRRPFIFVLFRCAGASRRVVVRANFVEPKMSDAETTTTNWTGSVTGAPPRPRVGCFVFGDPSGSCVRYFPTVLSSSSTLGLPSGALFVAVAHVLHVNVFLFTYFVLVGVGAAGRVKHAEHDPRSAIPLHDWLYSAFFGRNGATAISGTCRFSIILVPGAGMAGVHMSMSGS